MTGPSAHHAAMPVGPRRHDMTWLRTLGLASALATTGAGLASLALAAATGDAALAGVALVMSALTGWLLLARRLAVQGREPRYVGWMALGLIGSMIVLLPLVAEVAPTIAVACLIPLFLAVPYLDPRALRRWALGAWTFSVAYVLAASVLEATPEELAAGHVHLVLDVLGTAIIVGFVVLLIERYALADADARYMALHDGLTGLSNAALFMDRLEHAIAREERRRTATAVFYLDLDGFKAVNDRHGHHSGDHVLRVLAERLRSSVRSADTVARMGGDEFAVLLEDLVDRGAALAAAERLRRVTAQAIPSTDGPVTMRCSVGVAFSGDGGETAEALLRNADYAMYQSKRAHRGEVVVYHPSLRVAAGERRAVRRALNGVVERDELRLQFQPLVRLHSGLADASTWEAPAGTIAGLEALVRWHDPRHGLRGPDRFIAIAEETGDIVQLGRWVLEQACERLRDWQRLPGTEGLRMAVNVSAHQLQWAGFADEVDAIVAASGIEPSSLVLELTENVFVRDTPSIHATLLQLRSSGIRIALDDFGTGYSSFGFLRSFPVDTLKLDRSFVVGAVGDQRGTALLRAMVGAGVALGADLVAEGIETQAQLDLVRGLGCDLGQGFLLSPPLDGRDVPSLLIGKQRPWDRVLGTVGQEVDHPVALAV